MKKAFTMIELIFVIVILGILAGTALPKLAASRDDAMIVARAQEIQTAVSEIPAFIVTQGVVKAPQEMSQTLKQLVDSGKAKITSTNSISNSLGQLTLYTQNGGNIEDDAFILDLNRTTLVLKYGSTCNGVICKRLRERVSDANYSIGGENIVF